MTQKTAATDVASFLRENPDFFNQYPDILTEIRLKPKSSKHTISFAEHQIAYLRDRINELEQKMVELGTRYLQTIARRKGIERFYPKEMKPVATVYEYDRGGENDGRKLYFKHQFDDKDAKMDRGE